MAVSAQRGLASENPVRRIAKSIGGLWWLWIVFGVFWLAVAGTVLQFDQASVTTVGVLIGIMFLISGVQQLFMSAFGSGWARWVLLAFGLLLVVAAVITFIEPENTFAGIADVLGYIFLAIGVFWIIEAFAERGVNDVWWFGLISGVATVIIGFWTAGQFFIDRAYVLLVFAGVWALFHGVSDLIMAFQIRRVGRELEERAAV